MCIHFVQLGIVGGIGSSFLVVTQFPLRKTGTAEPANSEIIYAF